MMTTEVLTVERGESAVKRPQGKRARRAAAAARTMAARALADDRTALFPEVTQRASLEQLAWSMAGNETEDFSDDDVEDEPPYWSTRDGTVLKVILTAAALVVTGCALILYVHSRPEPVTPAIVTQLPTPGPSGPVVPTPPPSVSTPVVSPDDQYITALDRAGISSGQGNDAAISMGHAVCRALQRGETMDQVISEIKQANPDLQSTGAQIIADSAARFYCPQQER